MANDTCEQKLRELVAKWRNTAEANKYISALDRCVYEIEAILNEESEGWVLVPREPTEAMLDIGYAMEDAGAEQSAIYKAMIEAAPTRPADAAEGMMSA